MSLEEMITRLSERIAKSMRMKFSEFTGQDKTSIIIGFLAMLELVKRGAIRVEQEARGEIEMETDGVNLPTYG